MTSPLTIAKSQDTELFLLPALANRHGLITGATGTGKTVTLQVLAERFSSIGVPVFMADVKGDLSGLAAAGSVTPKLKARLESLGIAEMTPAAFPAVFWDVFGAAGHPVRATVSDMGPLLLGRLLNLNDTQAGVLQLVFRIADDAGLLLLDLKDLRAMVQHVGDNAKQFTTEYGNVSAASIGAIQRSLLGLEEQGGDSFFGEPMLDIPETVLGQLGNRVQHALRAFTPRDQKAVKTAAQTLRQNPKLDTETAITEMGVGEALVSFLDEKGRPTVVERAFILPPASRIGPLTTEERSALIRQSMLYGHYEQAVDRESAYERLKARAAAQVKEQAQAPMPQQDGGILGGLGDLLGGGGSPRGGRQTVVEAAVKSAARAIGSELGRRVLRGVLGSILGGGTRR